MAVSRRFFRFFEATSRADEPGCSFVACAPREPGAGGGRARALLACLVLACRSGEAPAPRGAAAGAPSQQPATADPVREEAARQAREAVERSVNPKKLPVYAGPVGSIRGTVKVTGDPPPLVPEMIEKLPAEGCARAHDLQRRVYRQGADRTLGDVLVTVTEYQGFVPAKADSVRVEIKDCAFDARLIAFTFGQRLEIFNLDSQPYMPRLVGTPTFALRVAMPRGGPVPIVAPRPGLYVLSDQTREYVRANVYVLNYPTFDVTGLDGEFEIRGIPVGEAKLTAFASTFGEIVSRPVTIRDGVTEEVQLEIPFSESEYRARAARAAAGGTIPSEPAGEPRQP